MLADPPGGLIADRGRPGFDIVALAALPGDFPAALVVVQHLDRRHRSLMADILSRRTRVQDAANAEFRGMPDAALATGLADFVLPLDDSAPASQKLCASIHD